MEKEQKGESRAFVCTEWKWKVSGEEKTKTEQILLPWQNKCVCVCAFMCTGIKIIVGIIKYVSSRW